MRTWRLLLPTLVGIGLLSALLVLASALADDADDQPRWHVPGEPLPGLPWGGCERTEPRPWEFSLIELPEARHARGRFVSSHVPPQVSVPEGRAFDRDTSGRFLHFVVTAKGLANLGPLQYDIRQADIGAQNAMEWHLAHLANEAANRDRPLLGRQTTWSGWRAGFDRSARWSEVRVCLRAALFARAGMPPLQIEVRGDSRHKSRWMHVRLLRRRMDDSLGHRDWGIDHDELVRLAAEFGHEPPPPGPPEPVDPPAVTATRTGDGASAYTVIHYGGRDFVFPAGDRFDDADFARAANASWAAFMRHAATLPREPWVTLDLDGALDVPWAYILGLVDVLADLGVRRLNLPSSKGDRREPTAEDLENGTSPPLGPQRGNDGGLYGMVLAIEPLPPPLSTPDCSGTPDHAPLPWWPILAGLLAAALVAIGIWRIARPHVGAG